MTKVVIVREFLTIPLLICSPLLFSQRRRTLYLLHHNLAQAEQSRHYAFALYFLSKIGFRFVNFEMERSSNYISGLPLPIQIALTIPHPADMALRTQIHEYPISPYAGITVGVIGMYRPEKADAWVFKALASWAATGNASIRILLGSSNASFSALFGGLVELVDTDSSADYATALHRCDIVVFPYNASAYAGRASGAVADAIAQHCVPVVPDLPLLRQQVTYPNIVGTTFTGPENFSTMMDEALCMVKNASTEAARCEYLRYRSSSCISELITEWCKVSRSTCEMQPLHW